MTMTSSCAAMPTGPHVERAASCGGGGENRLQSTVHLTLSQRGVSSTQCLKQVWGVALLSWWHPLSRHHIYGRESSFSNKFHVL